MIATCLALALAAPAAAPAAAASPSAPDPELQAALEGALAGFDGVAGAYVRQLGSGRWAGVRADATFPTASMIKVPILAAVLARVERGELDYGEPLVFQSTRVYPGEDLLGLVRDGEELPLNRLLLLTATLSDNTAALWLQELAGGGAAVNAWLDARGFSAVRVNSRTEGRDEARREFGWGQTTPRAMAELLAAAADGRALAPAAAEELLRVLSRSFWDGEALSELPPGVHAASKQGAVDAARSEVLLVSAPSGRYALCVATKGQRDRSWDRDNAGFALLRRASRAVWRALEGGAWEPAPGRERYYKKQ